MNRAYMDHVISVTGEGGNPQPATWKILLEDHTARGGVREIEITDEELTDLLATAVARRGVRPLPRPSAIARIAASAAHSARPATKRLLPRGPIRTGVP